VIRSDAGSGSVIGAMQEPQPVMSGASSGSIIPCVLAWACLAGPSASSPNYAY